MLEESEARRRILESATPGPVTWVPLELGLDQALAHDIAGAIDSPPFDNSAMDGWAVRAEDAATGARLRIAGETQAAGTDLGLSLAPGEAIRIFTGAPVPAGADAVLMQEDAEREEGELVVTEGVEPGEHVRRRGGDVCAGQRLLRRGDRVTPTRIGLLASQGIAEMPVHARPLVQVVTTGDELVEPGAPLIPGEIYDSNAPMLQTAVNRAGGVGMALHAPDCIDETRRVLEAALSSSNLVVVAGGVSVGDRDLVKGVLDDCGVVTDFWRIRVKPGKPFLFGRHLDGALVFGLPGNPVSAFVTFSLFVAPAIRRLLGFPVGASEVGLGAVRGAAAQAMANDGDRPHYLRCVHEDGVIRLSGAQQSHAIFGLSRANCLVRLEAGQEVMEGEAITGWTI